MSRSPFDALVDAYDAARPAYPAELFDVLDRVAGPLAGARVVDVGAGTGIATRALLARGADVVAADLGSRMLERLVTRDRDAERSATGRLLGAVVADAHSLPLRDGCADLVTYAQAFHWTRPVAAVAEARRVLRRGGALAVWWNDVDATGEPWWQEQQARLEAMHPSYRRTYRAAGDDPLAAAGFPPAARAVVQWSRRIGIDDYLVWLHSKSYVAALGDREPEFLAAERASLLAAFPDGVVHEPFRTRIYVART